MDQTIKICQHPTFQDYGSAPGAVEGFGEGSVRSTCPPDWGLLGETRHLPPAGQREGALRFHRLPQGQAQS